MPQGALRGQEERERIIARYLAPFGLPRRAMTALAEACETASPAILRQMCEGLKRNLVIGERLGWDMRCGAVFDRVLAAVAPHPDLGKPRLWALGANDKCLATLPWPPPKAGEVGDDAPVPPQPAAQGAVVRFSKGGG